MGVELKREGSMDSGLGEA